MPGSILVIDDSPAVRRQIVQTLRAAAIFDRYFEAEDGIEGFKTVVAVRVDLIICDLEMPRMDGFKFISLLNSREDLKDIPVIMITGREDLEMKIKGLEKGAVDYVTKPFDAGELVARVRVQQKIKTLQDELRQSNEMLKELSNTDYLTRLYNRRFITNAMENEFQRARRKKGHLSLIIADVDHFKRVNDIYGHQQGDVVLAEIARVTKGELRRYDIAARYGGEEFLFLLPDAVVAEAHVVAERLRAAVQGMTFPPPMDELVVTISLGLAFYPGKSMDSTDELVREADAALYRAKELGRNRVEVMAGG